MNKFDLSSMDRSRLIIIIVGVVVALSAIVGLIVVLTQSGDSPGRAEATPDVLPSATPTPSPSATIGPPTETPTPAATPTLEPYRHVVQAEETLLYIIQQYGYIDLAVVPEILVLNGMANENDLQAGQTLLIPRQTPTPGAAPTTAGAEDAGGEAAPAAGGGGGAIEYTDCTIDNRCISPDGQYWIHIVQEGDTVAGIAHAYGSRVPAVLEANNLPNDPIIGIGTPIYVPILVTLTPTLTPTGGPGSTATPTPTQSPPILLAPAPEAEIARGEPVALQWVPIRSLEGDQHYLVVVRNLDTGEEFRATTRSDAYRLPEDLQPGVGQSMNYEWQVVIVDGKSPDSPVVGGQGGVWTFTWGG